MGPDESERARTSRAARTPTDNDIGSRGMMKFIGQVTSDTSSLVPGNFIQVRRAQLLGAEAQGGAATLTPLASQAFAYLLGPGAPATGDYLITTWEGNRWVVEFYQPTGGGSGGNGTTPFCFCTNVPTTLSMVSANETCNFGMFQSCQITYQPVPAAFAPFGFTGSIFTSYPDAYPDAAADGAMFYYYLTCQYNQYSLTRLYLTSPYGSPFRDAVLFSWLIGGTGNTCSPFQLTNGTGFPGNNPSCSVTISG